jgi:hypothetical protein
MVLALAAIACTRSEEGGGATATSASASGAPAASSGGRAREVPVVRDDGPGRATAALRAAFDAFGIRYDTAALLRECKVDAAGASIDDLEEAARNHGLSATQMILPREHVFLPAVDLLPAIVVLDGEYGRRAFALAYRRDGDKIELMHPIKGRSWVPAPELARQLFVHEMPVDAGAFRDALASPSFGGALAARLATLGVDRAATEGLLALATKQPGWHGLATLDATVRAAEAGAGVMRVADVGPAFECALTRRCDADAKRIPEIHWAVRPAPNAAGRPQVLVRGTVIVALGPGVRADDPGGAR